MNWYKTTHLARVGIVWGTYNFVADDFLGWNGIQEEFTKSDFKPLSSLGIYDPINDIINANFKKSTYNRYVLGRESISIIENRQHICYVGVNNINYFYTDDISENVFDRTFFSYHLIKYKIINIVIISNIVFVIFYLTYRHSLF